MPWIDGPKAILEVELGGQAVGGAIVDILSGTVNPSGKLAETFPVRIQDTPTYLNYPGEANKVYYGERLFVGYRYYDKKDIKPLFPFGYGLSYTTFEYTNLRINKTELNTGETLDVTVNIRNTGPRAGKEIIQLYIEPLTSMFSRPHKELKAFAKVALEPGEAKDVHLTLEDRDFQIYDDERQIWRIDGGEYNILIGSSSESIVLSGQVKVNEDLRAMMPLFTRMSPINQFIQYPKTHELLTHALTGIPRAELFLGDNEMFTSMPIAKLVVHGILTDKKIDTLIERANQMFSK